MESECGTQGSSPEVGYTVLENRRLYATVYHSVVEFLHSNRSVLSGYITVASQDPNKLTYVTHTVCVTVERTYKSVSR